MKFSRTMYLHAFTATVFVLALVRCGRDYYNGTMTPSANDVDTTDVDTMAAYLRPDTHAVVLPPVDRSAVLSALEGDFRPHRINSVPSYKVAFPDSNDVQLASAQRWGVSPVLNRADAERRMNELVYIGVNPYYHVDNLRESIPYLVPAAAVLLQDIGRSFYDSLFVKGVPMQQIVVSSVLRSEEDVARLRRHNGNASENSCHRFGTTFDICYNRFRAVETEQTARRQVRNDTLKWVLSEVLRDMRQQGRCHVKYEVHQGCFHITVK